MRERIRQFREASRLPSATDYALAREILAGPLFALFEAQHPRDIIHSAATANWLVQRGHHDHDLLAAALLHDIGKGEQRRVDRVGYVVAGELRLAGLLADERSPFAFRRALARSLTHSTRGAGTLERAGAPARVVELTRLHHSDPGRDAILRLLQVADSAS